MAGGAGSSGEERGLVRYGWAAGARTTAAASRAFGRNCGREDEGGGVIAGET